MRFHLLGPLRAESGSETIHLGPPKQRAVLAVLLLRPNEVVSTERIIDQVWGESPPRTADHSVQIYVSDLRKSLGSMIETRPPGYVINTPRDTVDLFAFEKMARDGMDSIADGAIEEGRDILEEGQELLIGEPLQEFEDEEWAQAHIRAFRELRSDAREALASALLETGDLSRAREVCRHLIDEQPFREEPTRLMMLSLYRAGRQAEALRCYREYEERLGRELGVSPSVDLRRVEEMMLIQDPSLVASSEAARKTNPYRGLRAFTEEDSEIYFGREELVEEILSRLASGRRLVSMVGPSGSGKSSALQAGVAASLRKKGEALALMQPGTRPLWELSGVLDSAGVGSRSRILERLETDPHSLGEMVEERLTLLIDQFEELFTLCTQDVVIAFCELLSNALLRRESGLAVVTALRADHFDRPLSVPSLAALFAESTVSVAPLTVQGLERAIVEPARWAGRRVDPMLLAQLVADMQAQPGALPLLQYTLFEICERAEKDLDTDIYARVGGVRGALKLAADETLAELHPRERQLAEQLFMRLVKKGRLGVTATPVLLREVMDLGDHVDLQRVLERFGARRLLTFGMDAANQATIEVAHEHLIGGWPQLEDWLDSHGSDVTTLAAIRTAVEDWEANHRSEDYLFRGERLEAAVQFRDRGSLRLTAAEQEFIERSVELRDRPPPPPDAVVWFETRGDGSFGDLVGAGIDLAIEELGVSILEYHGHISQMSELESAISRGGGLVLLASMEAANPQVEDLMSSNPDVQFVLLGAGPMMDMAPQLTNVRRLEAANQEMGFLGGVVAALATDSGRVGFIGGTDSTLIRQFHAGFEQGVHHVDPRIVVEPVYLTGRSRFMADLSGFNSVAMGEAGASYLHRQGVDTMFHAAGQSGWGMFTWAASHLQHTGEQVWAIGVDVDQARQLESVRDEWELSSADYEAMREVILTSVIWRLDHSIKENVAHFLETGEALDCKADLASGGLDFVRSERLDRIVEGRLDSAVRRVVEGEIVIRQIPMTPVRLLFDLLGS